MILKFLNFVFFGLELETEGRNYICKMSFVDFLSFCLKNENFVFPRIFLLLCKQGTRAGVSPVPLCSALMMWATVGTWVLGIAPGIGTGKY